MLTEFDPRTNPAADTVPTGECALTWTHYDSFADARSLKAEWDPANLFHLNQNISPSRNNKAA